MRCAGILAYVVQRANFQPKNENDEFTIFLRFYVYFDDFLNFFPQNIFVESLPKY